VGAGDARRCRRTSVDELPDELLGLEVGRCSDVKTDSQPVQGHPVLQGVWSYGYDRRFGIIRIDYDTTGLGEPSPWTIAGAIAHGSPTIMLGRPS
jgi:hypothetical protein